MAPRIPGALLAALLCSVILHWSAHAAPPAASPSAIDRRTFDFAVHRALENQVMGHSFVLMHRDTIITEGAGGRARNPADGFMPMRADMPSSMGSLMKVMTGVTMLHILEAPPAGSAGLTDGDFRSRLDAPVALQFPKIWHEAIGDPALAGVNFRRYLQHRTGFGPCSGTIGCFSKGFKRRSIGVRSYQNINFSTLGFMIGVYTKPDILQAVNGMPDSRPVADRDMYFQISAGLQMDKFIREQMLGKVSRMVRASCDAANEYRSTAALAYASVSYTRQGVIISRKAAFKPCIGSGGYRMSARSPHQRSTRGPSAAPTAPARPMPAEYHSATKAGEASGHENEYPSAPSAPANSPAAKPAAAGLVGARPRSAHKLPTSAGSDKASTPHGQAHQERPISSAARVPGAARTRARTPHRPITTSTPMTAPRGAARRATGRDRRAVSQPAATAREAA